MKIIKKGQSAPVNWWVGAKLTCQTCGQWHELEAGDGNFFIESSFRVITECLNCRDQMVLVRLMDPKAADTAASPLP